jgi:hypothetical protein
MPTKRTPLERGRKAPLQVEPEMVALFRELEEVPEDQRFDNDAYRAKETRLAKRLGLWAECFLGAMDVNDKTLPDRFPRYDFRDDDWYRVTAMRARLLELAGLPPDPPLFWCRQCGFHNHNPHAVKARQCVACGNLDYPDNFANLARKEALEAQRARKVVMA